MTSRMVGPGIASRMADAAQKASQCSMDMRILPLKTRLIHRPGGLATANFGIFETGTVCFARPLFKLKSDAAMLRRPNLENAMELGLYTFADVNPEPAEGQRGVEGARRVRDLLEEIELADQVGLDVFGLGEHHRPDYVASSPATLLAAAAARTKNI